MPYTPLREIAAGFAEKISSELAGDFKLITHCQATGGGQLWEMLQALAAVPAAVVAVGNGDYEDNSLKRSCRVMVFVVAPFAKYLAKDADGVWDLLEKVLELFLPDFSDGVKFTQVCGIDFVPLSWNPIESDESISAYCLTFEGTEFLLK